MKTEILDSVRGKDIYIFQDVENHQPIPFNDSTTHRYLSVNDHLFSLFVTIDAAMQAGAERVNLVLPAFPYSRQHKKKGREGLTAARVGQMLEHLGVSRIITLDIHSREIENCFDKLRLENLHASLQIIEKLIGVTDISSEDLVILSPDTGAIDRNKFYANALGKPLALLYKERDYSKVSKNAAESNISEMKLLGDVKGKTVFMADDMIGTGGTLIKGMKNLKDMGAEKVICAVSLPFSPARPSTISTRPTNKASSTGSSGPTRCIIRSSYSASGTCDRRHGTLRADHQPRPPQSLAFVHARQPRSRDQAHQEQQERIAARDILNRAAAVKVPDLAAPREPTSE